MPLAVFGVVALTHRPAFPASPIALASPQTDTIEIEGCPNDELETCTPDSVQCGGAELGAPPKVSPFGCHPPRQSPNFEPPPMPEWWSKLTLPDLPIERPWEVHAMISKIIDSPKRRALMRAALSRGGAFAPQIIAELAARKLPRALVALPLLESAYSEVAVSKTGAVGLWQLMPKTARKLGLMVTPSYDERRNPERSTAVALDHLQHLFERFGTWDLALAAYDRGEPGVERAMHRAGVPDYWSLVDMHALPQETREYVPMLLALAIIYENAARFSLDGPRAPPRSIALLDVPIDTPLTIIARAAGTSLLGLRRASPELISGDTVPTDHVCIPAKGLARARAMLPLLLAEADEAAAPSDFDWGRDDSEQHAKRKSTHGVARNGVEVHGAEPTEPVTPMHQIHPSTTRHPQINQQRSVRKSVGHA